MARITAERWQEARAKREAGMSITDVAKWLKVDRALVSRRAKAENWSDGADLEETIRKKVTEKVTGIVTACDPKKREEAIEAVVDERVAVEMRHRAEWDQHKALANEAVNGRDFETAKVAKITAEMLKIRQEGERKAHRMDKPAEPNGVGLGPINIVPLGPQYPGGAGLLPPDEEGEV